MILNSVIIFFFFVFKGGRGGGGGGGRGETANCFKSAYTLVHVT